MQLEAGIMDSSRFLAAVIRTFGLSYRRSAKMLYSIESMPYRLWLVSKKTAQKKSAAECSSSNSHYLLWLKQRNQSGFSKFQEVGICVNREVNFWISQKNWQMEGSNSFHKRHRHKQYPFGNKRQCKGGSVSS